MKYRKLRIAWSVAWGIAGGAAVRVVGAELFEADYLISPKPPCISIESRMGS